MISQAGTHSGGRARLEQKIIAAATECLFQKIVAGMPRKKNNRGYPVAFHIPKRAAKVEAVHPRHFDIEQESVNLQGAGKSDSVLSGIGKDHIVSFRLEYALKDASGARIIIDDENCPAHVSAIYNMVTRIGRRGQ